MIALLFCSWVGISSCAEQAGDRTEVEIGVFYGGQIQLLSLVEIDRTMPPKIGFRVQLPRERDEVTVIHYEVVSVGPAGRRTTRKNQFEMGPGKRRVDQVIDVPDDARLGIWNIRVTDGREILADRALFLVEQSGV